MLMLQTLAPPTTHTSHLPLASRKRWMYSNQLSQLPDGLFDKLDKLQHLYVGRRGLLSPVCTLCCSHPHFQFPMGYNSSIRDNQLSEIPSNLFQGFISLQYLSVGRQGGSGLLSSTLDMCPSSSSSQPPITRSLTLPLATACLPACRSACVS